MNKIAGSRTAPTLKSLPAFVLEKPVDPGEWDMFALEKEYEMLGVPNSDWKLTV